MPAPQAALLADQIKQLITAEQVEVPTGYAGDDDFKYNRDYPEFDSAVPVTSNLFKCPGTQKIAVDTCNDISKSWSDFIDSVSGGICSSWSRWQSATSISGVLINAAVGQLLPGCMVGPPLMSAPLITADIDVGGKPAFFAPFALAAASGIGNAWTAWQTGYQVTLQYPAFASFPGPVAPPTPNVPLPLASGTSVGDPMMKKDVLATLMLSNLSTGTPDALTNLLFGKLAEGFCAVFEQWKGTTMIQNVRGTGPVPSFAPPFAPVGPVVGGVGNGAPGCIS